MNTTAMSTNGKSVNIKTLVSGITTAVATMTVTTKAITTASRAPNRRRTSVNKQSRVAPPSGDRDNINGKRNLEEFTSDLNEDRTWRNATAAVHDAAIDQARRWANIQDLHRRIDRVETDLLYQDDLVDQLEHMNKGKTDGISKLFGVIGSVGAVKYRVQAARDRDEAASLRDQLAQLENQSRPRQGRAFPNVIQRGWNSQFYAFPTLRQAAGKPGVGCVGR